MLFLHWQTACTLAEMDGEPVTLDTFWGCFRFSCELNEKKNVSLGNLIGTSSLTDVGVYYPTGTMFCSSELLIAPKLGAVGGAGCGSQQVVGATSTQGPW